jgi:serine/threonine protein kinase
VTVEVVCGYRLLRGLGARALPAYAAVDPKPGTPARALCVVERLAREPDVSPEAAAEFLRDAKRLAQVRHPNLVQVRDVVVGASTVLLVTDWVEAEPLSEVEKGAAAKGTTFPLAVSLRILVDLLEGLSAFHELRDAKREPLNLVHAEVAPRNVLVGVDGRSVLAHPLRAPIGAARSYAPEVTGYLAPEVLLGDQTADQRADVYGAGVLLWEALMGRRMHVDGEDVGEIVMRILGGKIDAPAAPADAPWAAPLAEAAKKATAPDPSVRFANATEMLTELRRSIGARLAPKTQIASIVDTAAGEHIRARRRALDASLAEKPAAASPPKPDIPPVVVAATPDVTPKVSHAATVDAPPSSIPVEVETLSVPPSPSASVPPSSADVVEVIEMEVPPDRPSRPRAPPPLRPRAAPPAPAFPPPPEPVRPPSASKTDVGSLALVSTPAGPITPDASLGRARWALIGLGALALLAAAWFFTRRAPEPGDSAETAVPSSAVSTQAPIPAPPDPARSAAAPSPVASAAHRAESSPSDSADPSPFEPQVDKPAPPPRTPTGKEAAPFPSAPPATPPPQPAPAPASSSPHPKKRVYDPMGI